MSQELGNLVFEHDIRNLFRANDIDPDGDEAESLMNEWSAGYYGYRPGWHAHKSALADLQKLIMARKFGVPQQKPDAENYPMPELEDVLDYFAEQFQESK